MRVAIVHDWLTTYSGAEFVLEQMIACFPDADLFTMVDFMETNREFLSKTPIQTSYIQRLPQARKRYRHYMPLMPVAVEQFDLTGYDLVISSSHAVAKGVITGPDQLHICMCYSPVRYAWDLQHQYLNETGLNRGVKGWLARYLLHKLRLWDSRTANGVDQFIGISRFIQRRIQKTYRRDSELIYPPVDTDFFHLPDDHERDNYYVTASRLVPYKRVELIVEAFAGMSDKKLIVIGDGPEMKALKKKVDANPNIKLLGRLPRDQVRLKLQRAKAFVFAAEEDFGIAPVEAQACGTPVIAYGRGGAKETVVFNQSEERTGVLFHEQTVNSLRAAIDAFEQDKKGFSAAACRANAERFAIERFRMEFKELIASQLENWGKA